MSEFAECKLATDLEVAYANDMQDSGFIHFSTYPHPPVDKSVDKVQETLRKTPKLHATHDFGENMTI